MASGYDVAADRLITFADTGLRVQAQEIAQLKGAVPHEAHIATAAWPRVDGGIRAAYDAGVQSFIEALDGLVRALETSADSLKIAAKEYEKTDHEISTALQGR